jgi:hypothetical protein
VDPSELLQEPAPPRLADGGIPDLVAAMHGGFGRAAAGGRDLPEDRFSFAGRPVTMRVAGDGLAGRTRRAFAHLTGAGIAGPGPALTIDLWDELETGIACPAAQALDRQWIACGGLLGASSDGRFVSFTYQESVTVLDRSGNRMVGCRSGASALSTGEYSKPLLVLLSIWYFDRGVQLLHAGLIASRGAGVLLPGESGTGKSTTSLASLAQGLEYLGDDFIGIERQPDLRFAGHSIYNTACITRENLVRFPELRAHAVDEGLPDEEKPILFLTEVYPDRMRTRASIDAIALVRIRQERTEVRPARRPEALRALAASTLHTVVPRPGREALEMMGELVERVPAYWLLLGPDLRDMRPGIEQIVSLAADHGDRGTRG